MTDSDAMLCSAHVGPRYGARLDGSISIIVSRSRSSDIIMINTIIMIIRVTAWSRGGV